MRASVPPAERQDLAESRHRRPKASGVPSSAIASASNQYPADPDAENAWCNGDETPGPGCHGYDTDDRDDAAAYVVRQDVCPGVVSRGPHRPGVTHRGRAKVMQRLYPSRVTVGGLLKRGMVHRSPARARSERANRPRRGVSGRFTTRTDGWCRPHRETWPDRREVLTTTLPARTHQDSPVQDPLTAIGFDA